MASEKSAKPATASGLCTAKPGMFSGTSATVPSSRTLVKDQQDSHAHPTCKGDWSRDETQLYEFLESPRVQIL